MKKITAALLLAPFLALSACAPESEQGPAPTPTLTATPTPMPTSTPTSAPETTPAPTETPEPQELVPLYKGMDFPASEELPDGVISVSFTDGYADAVPTELVELHRDVLYDERDGEALTLHILTPKEKTALCR